MDLKRSQRTVQQLLDYIRFQNGNQLPEEVSRILNLNYSSDELSCQGGDGNNTNNVSESVQSSAEIEIVTEQQSLIQIPSSHLNPAELNYTGNSTNEIICGRCKEVFPSLMELSKHSLTHCKLSLTRLPVPPPEQKFKKPRSGVKIYEFENMFNCGACEERFTSRGKGLTHWKRVHLGENEPELFKCLTCGKVLSSSATLRQHVRGVHAGAENQSGHLCAICGQEFRLEKYLKKHVAYVHVREKSFRCSHCPAAFVNSHSLKAHVDRHLRRNEQQCPYCGILQSRTNIKSHIEFIHEGKRLQCNFCEELFSSSASVRTHFHVKHPEKSDFSSVREVVTPVRIDLLASTEVNMSGHINTDLQNLSEFENPGNSFAVEIELQSSQEFAESSETLTNSDSAIIPKRQCQICFKFYTHLEAHHLTAHSTKPQFKCKFCERDFKAYSSLHSHVRWFHLLRSGKLQVTRSKTKPRNRSGRLVCLLCNVSFNKRIPYRIHMQRHEKDPDYRAIPRKRVPRLGEPEDADKSNPKAQPSLMWQIKPPFSLLDCPYDSCPLSFTGIHHLRVHLKAAHPDFSGYAEKVGGNEETDNSDESRKSPCPTCGKLIFWCNLKRHISQVHRGERDFHCSVCDKSFHQKTALELHETTKRHREMQNQQRARENIIMIVETI